MTQLPVPKELTIQDIQRIRWEAAYTRKTQREIANQFGITRERAARIIRREVFIGLPDLPPPDECFR